mgnify:CR=1 FL=1
MACFEGCEDQRGQQDLRGVARGRMLCVRAGVHNRPEGHGRGPWYVNPKRAVRLQYAPCLSEPFASEFVINGETCEFIPFVVDGIDLAIVRTQQIATKLQIIGRISKDHVDGAIRQGTHRLNAVHA